MIKLTINNNIQREIEIVARSQAAAAKDTLVKKLAEATPVDTGRARAGWRVEDGNIVNDVEYISELNHGTSKQAPSHFIERTILEDGNFKLNGSITKDR